MIGDTRSININLIKWYKKHYIESENKYTIRNGGEINDTGIHYSWTEVGFLWESKHKLDK